MDRIVFFGRVFACKTEDDVATTWMIGKEIRDIPDRPIEYDLASIGY
jgi:hypothetical protein